MRLINSKMKYWFCVGIMTLVAVAAIISSGCKKIDTPVLVDEDEIKRFVNEAYEAQELFRTGNLITNESFTFGLDAGATYTDHLDSTSRSIYVRILVDGNTDYDYYTSLYNEAKVARATVEDILFVTTRRVKGIDTVFTESVRTLVRYGIFAKLGDDSQSYAGWLLRAYNGGTSSLVSVVAREDGSSFGSGHQGYLSLSPPDEIARIADGEDLVARSIDTTGLSHGMTIGYETSGGFSTRTPVPAGDFDYVAELNTPTGHSPSWNIMFFQEYRRLPGDPLGYVPINTLVYRGWCVPYRVN